MVSAKEKNKAEKEGGKYEGGDQACKFRYGGGERVTEMGTFEWRLLKVMKERDMQLPGRKAFQVEDQPVQMSCGMSVLIMLEEIAGKLKCLGRVRQRKGSKTGGQREQGDCCCWLCKSM